MLVIVDAVVDSVTSHWPVYNPDEFARNIVAVRQACYDAGIPVIQIQHTYRADGANLPLGEDVDEHGGPLACVPGTPGHEIIPELQPVDRDIIVQKHRTHAFFGTELASVLHRLGAEQLLWVGGFTEACLGGSVLEGFHHDYPGVLVADAASCANEFTHQAAVLNLANWVYDLTVFSTANLVAALGGEHDAPRWYSSGNNQVEYRDGADVARLYAEVLAGSPPSTAAA